jgi:hypothetical protein
MKANSQPGYKLLKLTLLLGQTIHVSKEISKTTGLGSDALKHAAQRGKLKAVKIGRNWATTRSWVMEYLRHSRKARKRLPPSMGESIEGS